jgi:hypothetical protein
VQYQLLADAVLFLHFGVVAFVVGGLIAVIVGNLRGWRWVNGWWFRLAHLAAIAVIVAQAWLGRLCPLTTLESWLRIKAGSTPYAGSFMQEWMQRIIFHEAPLWVFAAAYTAFATLVVASWWYFPPRPPIHTSATAS